MEDMINIIGLGYIGLPTALMFAKHGVKVVGTDYNSQLVNSLKQGELTFEEKGLEELFQSAIEGGIEFSTEYQKSDMYIVAVPTPYMKDSKKLDQKYLISAVTGILDVCNKGAIIIIESTISPGSIDKHIRPLIEDKGLVIGEDIHLVHAPERIIPGNMIYELEHNSRTIGADSVEIAEKVKGLYASFCKSEIILTDIRSAEMSKVVENTFRDINIAFANELARIAHSEGMDVYEIIRIANHHPRVNILQPGPGVGGHCIPVDPWFLVGDYPELTNLIHTARKTNDDMPNHVFNRIREIMREHNISDISKVGLYGLAYKEDVDDVRESPSLQLLEKMEEASILGVKSFDPFVKEKLVEGQVLGFEEFVNDVEVIVVMVGHQHLKENLELIKTKHILDTKNITAFENAYHL